MHEEIEFCSKEQCYLPRVTVSKQNTYFLLSNSVYFLSSVFLYDLGRCSVLDLLPATKDFGFRPPFLSHCWDFGCPRSHSSIPTSHCPAWLLSIHLHFLLIKCLYLPLHDWSLPWTFIFYFFIYSHVHTLFGPFLPPSPCPLPLRSTLLTSRQNLFCPLLQFCWRENISNNKKGKAFLLVEIRIAIQRDS
jgi:hypothetical protein